MKRQQTQQSDESRSPAHHHGHRHRHEGLLTTLQALFGGSVVYRLAAHVLKQPDVTAQVERLIPNTKMPLLAAGVVAAAAIGLFGQQRRAAVSERELGRALDEMTAEARALREENSELRHEAHEDRPRGRVSEVEHEHRVQHNQRHKA